jgi:phosphoribosylglycinamide formyltransferase-1
LCSGGGGNLRFVAGAIRKGWLADAEVCAVLSDRACGANTFARANGIATEVLDCSPFGQQELLARLRELAPDVVVTTIHKTLVPALVDAFAGRLLNLHYSLLPAFAGEIGERPVVRALAHGVKFLGVTVHHVEAQLDMGRPILQAVTAAPADPQLGAMMNVLFRAGCVGLLNAIASFGPGRPRVGAQDSATLAGRQVYFSPAVLLHPSLEDERGWDFLDE